MGEATGSGGDGVVGLGEAATGGEGVAPPHALMLYGQSQNWAAWFQKVPLAHVCT